VASFLSAMAQPEEDLKNQLSYYLKYMSYINSLNISGEEKTGLVRLFKESLNQYGAVAFYGALRDLSSYLESEAADPGWLDRAIMTSVEVPARTDPYQDFMIRANAADKYWRLVFYNSLLGVPRTDLPAFLTEGMKQALTVQGTAGIPGLENLMLLGVYTQGLERPSSGGRINYYNYFEVMQFPAYPEAPDAYLGKDDYFLMGDNRYNSLDARLGRDTRFVTLDPADTGAFARRIEVSWDGHVMTTRHIQGRVRMILFPFSRVRFF